MVQVLSRCLIRSFFFIFCLATNAVHQTEHHDSILPQLPQPHMVPKTSEHPEHNSESHAVVVSYPNTLDSQPTESTEDIVVEIHLPTQRVSTFRLVFTLLLHFIRKLLTRKHGLINEPFSIRQIGSAIPFFRCICDG